VALKFQKFRKLTKIYKRETRAKANVTPRLAVAKKALNNIFRLSFTWKFTAQCTREFKKNNSGDAGGHPNSRGSSRTARPVWPPLSTSLELMNTIKR